MKTVFDMVSFNMHPKREKLCPRDCQYLDPKECDQTDKKESHFCRLHKCVVKHEGKHPELVATPDCTFDTDPAVGPFLFLDIDGVINDHEWLISQVPAVRAAETMEERDLLRINPNRVELLNLLAPFGFKVVISSCWRLGKKVGEMAALLLATGLKLPVVGITPYLAKGNRQLSRGMEIHCWLEENGSCDEKFVIIDDSSDMGPLLDHLVRTNTEVGLTEKNVIEAKSLLNGRRTGNYFTKPILKKELKEGMVYLLDARCGNIGMWSEDRECFLVPSYSCGRRYLEEESYWNKKAREGSALPLMPLGLSAIRQDERDELLEYLGDINSKAENACRLAAFGIEPTIWWIKEINWKNDQFETRA